MKGERGDDSVAGALDGEEFAAAVSVPVAQESVIQTLSSLNV